MPNESDFRKVLRLGTIPTHGGASVSVFCSATYAAGRLSISGVEGPRRSGNCYGSCGQIEMSYRTDEERATIAPAPGWTAELVGRFFDAWRAWHLNDIQAGSPAQMEAIEEHRAEFPGYPVSFYDWAVGVLSASGLHPDPDYLHDGKPYAYGSAWLAVDVPAEVLDFLRSLPDTDRTPAWV